MVYLVLAELCVFYGFMVRNVNIKVFVTALISALLGFTCIKAESQLAFSYFMSGFFCSSDYSTITTRSHEHMVDVTSGIIRAWPFT